MKWSSLSKDWYLDQWLPREVLSIVSFAVDIINHKRNRITDWIRLVRCQMCNTVKAWSSTNISHESHQFHIFHPWAHPLQEYTHPLTSLIFVRFEWLHLNYDVCLWMNEKSWKVFFSSSTKNPPLLIIYEQFISDYRLQLENWIELILPHTISISIRQRDQGYTQ